VFSVLFLLFIRFLPVMPMAELKAVTPQADVHRDDHAAHKTGFGDPVSVEQGGPKH
jgi:molybdopterin-containing oxidoreductase family membrane subunit